MGRILEALKRTDEPALTPEVALAAASAEMDVAESVDEAMPFVEVGEPRKAPERLVGLQATELRPPALRVQEPASVVLRPYAATAARLAPELIAFHQPEHAVSRQYAALFAQMAGDAADGSAPVLLLTALTPGAGTTTALLNLAIAGCRPNGKRIVVVDANRGRPAVASRLGIAAPAGLHEVLQGSVALEQAVLATPVKGLHAVAAGAGADAAGNGDALRWVLAWLRQRFDVVMVDAPAWDASADLRSLVPAASAVYLVTDAAEAEQGKVRAVTRGVAQLGSRLGGMIVTQ